MKMFSNKLCVNMLKLIICVNMLITISTAREYNSIYRWRHLKRIFSHKTIQCSTGNSENTILKLVKMNERMKETITRIIIYAP